MKRLSIPEVLQSLEGKSHEEVVRKLRVEDTRALRVLLYLSFNKDLSILLPKERPEGLKLQEVPVGLSSSSLFIEHRKLIMFIKGSRYDSLSNSKRESIFINILESIHKDEAELLLQVMIDRKLQSSITYDDVFEAFPGILPSKSEEKPEPVVEEKPEPVVEEKLSKDEEVEDLEERIEDLQEALEDLKSDLEELNKEETSEEEPESFKNLSELYENESEKKTKTKKKSSKKKSK